jgi:predicted nucleotidyltransferase
VQRESDREQLARVTELVREVLGAHAVGAYLHGSAVLGGLRPLSDLDVLVVARRRTTSREKRGLAKGLLALSSAETPAGRTRPVELTVVAEPDVRPWRHPASVDFQYGEWLRDEFERGEAQPWETPSGDLASLVHMTLLADAPLFGPPPAEVLGPVPRADYVAAMVDGIAGLLRELEHDTRNVVLTLARIWSTVATGEIRTKDGAAAWALDRLPPGHRAVLARARAVYLGHEEERWDDLEPHVGAHVRHVVAEIERLVEAA